ncbi:MAG: hypothetical protein HY565_01140 [Candidatus Kerfeldbacteria bacterium]|nr:hypothetical protein [Candidatus Kerfeldbacteria bacterium]
MHHKVPMLGGLGLVILGVVLFLTNYGWLSMDVWQWLLPVALVVGGIHCSMCCAIKRMDDCKMHDESKGSCCKTDGEMKK